MSKTCQNINNFLIPANINLKFNRVLDFFEPTMIHLRWNCFYWISYIETQVYSTNKQQRLLWSQLKFQYLLLWQPFWRLKDFLTRKLHIWYFNVIKHLLKIFLTKYRHAEMVITATLLILVSMAWDNTKKCIWK